jgi:hypothetical protein
MKKLSPKKKAEWSPEWPTESGYYWFYGKKYGMGDNRLHLVQILDKIDATCKAGVTDGHLIYNDGMNPAKGVWQPADLPDLPVNLGVNDG